MANTISNGTITVTPELILGWDANQDARTIVHEIIGKPSPDVTLKPANLRTGNFELLFLTATEAETARTMLAGATTFLIESDEPWLDLFSFVVSGSITSALEDTTRNLWTISADFQEVTP